MVRHRRGHAKVLMRTAPSLLLIGMLLCLPWPPLSAMRISPASAAASGVGAFPQTGVDSVPASVEQLTVAFDGWGGDVIDPWQYIGTGMMQSYLNLRLLHRDEGMNIVPLWATEWRQTQEGIYLTLNPKVRQALELAIDKRAIVEHFH